MDVAAIVSDLIKVGKVSTTDETKGTVRVKFDDRKQGDGHQFVSGPLQVIYRNSLKNKDTGLPDIDEPVLCVFLPNGTSQGFCLGAFYPDGVELPVKDKDKRHVTFEDGSFVEYDRKNHELTADIKGTVIIKATKGVKIEGDVQVKGNITATGSIIDAGGNTNHHSH